MTKVKICGLSTPEAVATAVEAGADYIGFVFAKSKRQVSLEQAHGLAKGVTGQTKIVGVFVSPSLEELEKAIGQVPLDIVQIHGTFDEALIPKISVPVIRAIQISDSESQVKSQADYLLFDAPIAGSGQTFDWQLLADKQIGLFHRWWLDCGQCGRGQGNLPSLCLGCVLRCRDRWSQRFR